MLPAPFRLEGSTLPVALPPRFEAFYRAKLRRVFGSRIRSKDLMIAYTGWATEAGASSMTFAQMRKLMELVGHRRIQSNGISYDDVGFAEAFPDVLDTLKVATGGVLNVDRQTPSASADLIAKVDVALAGLLDLRRELVAAADHAPPHVSAARVLGRE